MSDKEKNLIYFSPSKLGRFLECKACFWRDYYRKNPPGFPLPSILNRMDLITKEYYDGFRDSLPPILEDKLEGLVLVSGKEAEIFRNGIIYRDLKNNFELSGKLDDCLIDSSKKYSPLDNKTATPGNDSLLKIYQMQLDCYAFLLNQNDFPASNQGFLIYYVATSGNPQKGVIFKPEVKKLELNPERIPSVLLEASLMLKARNIPEAKTGCKMCSYVEQLRKS
jgi:hypothetical protein